MSDTKMKFSFDGSDFDKFSKGLGDISEARQDREFRNYHTPEQYTVTDWENDKLVQSSFETLTDYLTEEKGMGNYLVDQATTGQTTDPAEFMRDLTARLGAPLATAKALEDAPENVKESFRIMKSRWDKAEVKGGKEQLDRVLDYGADVIFSPEGIATIGGLLSGVTTFGAGTAATIGTRKIAQQQATSALMNAVKATKAASTKNPLKSSALIGSIYGGGATHLAQELDIAADIKDKEDYSVGETAFGTAIGAAAGPALIKTVGLFGAGSKLAADYFREGTKVPKEISLKEARQVFDDGIEGEWIPASGKELVDEVQKLLEGPTTTLKDVTPDQVTTLVNKFTEDLGGGEKTKAEIKRIIRAAADAEDTVSGQTNRLVQGLYTVASDISGNFFGKAAGVLSPITKFSGTAAQLQKKLSYEFGIKYKGQDKLVEKDLSEVQREITGKYNERFRAIVDELSMSEIDTKLATEMNAALSLSLRSTKSLQHEGFDEATNKAINRAAKEIKSLYNDMGVNLLDIGVFTKMVDNYVPRMWKRSAVENNQEELADLFVSKAGMSKEEAEYTVKSMLKIKNQVDQGTGGGYFFSSKRKIDTIGNDADFEKFLNNDVLGTLHGYTYQAGKSLAKHRVLGVNNFSEFQGFYVNRIRKEMEEAGQKFTPKIEKQVELLYRTATGEGMERFGRFGQNVVDGYSFTNRVALLGLATLSSLTEIMINVGKAGVRNSVKGFNDAMKQSHKTITKDLQTKLQTEQGLTAKEALSEMRSFSIHVDQALAQVGDRLAGDELVSETMQKASNKFFRLNMLDQWTKFVQSVSFSSGKHLINDNITKLASYGSRPLDKAGQDLAEELAELDIDYVKAVDWYKAGSKTDDEFYKSSILGGAARYTNSVVLQPTAMSGLKPLLYSKPKTAVLFQLLSYPVAFTNTVMKGAAKKLIKNPKRNAGKLVAAGTIMTGMARWTNYLRTGGENERGKETDDIIYESIARWGGNGILLDSLKRAQTAAKYSRSNFAYATLPFGPLASDSLSLIQQGIIPTVGNKIPVVSGSYFGKQILGEAAVTDYRRGLKETQKEVFGEFIPKFEDEVALPGYAVGGAVSALSKLAVKSIAELGTGNVGTKRAALEKVTEGLIDSKVLEKTSQALEGDVALINNSNLNSFDVKDYTDAAIVVEFKKDYKTFDELESMDSWRKAMLSDTREESKLNWKTARTDMGFDDDYKLSLQTIEELEGSVSNGEEIRNTVSSILTPIKSAYKKLKVDITDEDIVKSSRSKFNNKNLDLTKDFLSQYIKDSYPLVSIEGAPKISDDILIKLTAEGNIDFDKFKAPKLSSDEVDSVVANNNKDFQKSYVADSVEKEPVHRYIDSFVDSEYNVSFAFARETGTHAGSSGASQNVSLRSKLYQVYKDNNLVQDKYANFLKRNPNNKDYEKEFESLLNLGKSRYGEKFEFKTGKTQVGYIKVKNPLVYQDSENVARDWGAEKLLGTVGGTEELFNTIKNQNVKITKDFVSTIIDLEDRALDLNLAPTKNVSVLDRIRTDLMLYELNTDFRNALKSLGFDSIKYLNEAEPSFKGESPFSYILFEPNQFKLTSSSKFDADDPRQAFVVGGVAKILAPKLSSGFFSAAHKAALKIEGSKPKAGQSFINQLKKDNAVTEEELEWTGAIEKFGNNKPVTKEEVVKHFEDSEFDFEVYTGRHVDRKENIDEYDLPIDDLNDEFETPDKDFWNWLEDNHPHEIELADELADSAEWTKWFDGRYDEFTKDKGSDFITQPYHIDFSFDGQFTENYRELVIGLKDKFKKLSRDYKNEAHHPTLKNQLLHIRLADIKDANDSNKKTLLIDELQSDKSTDATGPEGVGYAMKDEDIAVGNNTRDEAKLLADRYSDLTEDMEEIEEILEEMSPDELASPRADRLRSEHDRISSSREEVGEKHEALQSSEDIMIDYKVPNLPLKEESRWALVGLRKAMITAAEEGYDQVALTTGQIQKIRNNKIIGADKTTVSQFPNKDLGGYVVRTFDSEGGEHSQVFADPEDAAKYLKKTIGKESFDELMKSEANEMGEYSLNTEHSFQRGGKRFEQFYDKTLPKMIKKHFGKKYNTTIKYVEYKQGSKTVKLPTIKITPEMRKDIRKGLPMFAEGGEVKKEHVTKSSFPVQGSTIEALTSNLKEEK